MPSAELELLVWVRTGWKDHRLAWKKEEYGGIDQLSFSARLTDVPEQGDVWVPDLEMYNTPVSLHTLSHKAVMLWLVHARTHSYNHTHKHA